MLQALEIKREEGSIYKGVSFAAVHIFAAAAITHPRGATHNTEKMASFHSAAAMSSESETAPVELASVQEGSTRAAISSTPLPEPATTEQTSVVVESEPLPVFQHATYRLQDNNLLIKNTGNNSSSSSLSLKTDIMSEEDELQTLIEAIASYVRSYLKARFGLIEHFIPSDDAAAKCNILLSHNWDTASNLLVILQNHVGSQMGIWSRSTCIQKGLRTGSMIPFLERAHDKGFAVIICNPNLNSVMVRQEDGSMEKMPVHESSFPEEHAMYVYENFVSQSQAKHVCLFGYGNGAILCKEMLQVRSLE